jgi:hypothetical protein
LTSTGATTKRVAPVLLFRDANHRPDTGIISRAKVRAVARAVHKRFCPMSLRVVRGAAAHRTATDFHLRRGIADRISGLTKPEPF